MNFTLNHSLEILKQTPFTLQHMLGNLSDEWTATNEGGDSWSAFDIVGHLIHGEKTDWMPRLEIILSNKTDKSFVPFDRFAQYETSKGKTLHQLLVEFKELRDQNVAKLETIRLSGNDFEKTGIHPDFGPVTLSQLLATWTVHDLNHIYQISRVMAKQYMNEVGPWVPYLRILNE